MTHIHLELFSAILGISAVFFDTQERIMARPLSIIAMASELFVFLNQELYAICLLNAMYILLDLYGWHQWQYGGKFSAPLRVTRVTSEEVWKLLLAGFLSAFLFNLSLRGYFKTEIAYFDSINVSFCLIAYWLLMKKKLEGWILSFICELYYASICYYQGLYGFFTEHMILSILALHGYISWRNTYLSESFTTFHSPTNLISSSITASSEDGKIE